MKIEKLNVDFGAMDRMKEQIDSVMKGAKEVSDKVNSEVETKLKSPLEVVESRLNRAKEVLENPETTYNTANRSLAADAKGMLDTAAEVLRSKLQKS